VQHAGKLGMRGGEIAIEALQPDTPLCEQHGDAKAGQDDNQDEDVPDRQASSQ